jgi:hypothetical protein
VAQLLPQSPPLSQRPPLHSRRVLMGRSRQQPTRTRWTAYMLSRKPPLAA